jgi:tRNA pseudouridine38-40 synthase
MRIKAVIAYDGSSFEGFQRQTRTSNTITTALENALRSLGIESPLIGSGRTDAGVHATGQVIHLDLPSYWNDMAKLRAHLNGRLHRIQVKHIAPVADDFHARFDANRRVYRYLFSERPLSVFEQSYVAHVGSLDLLRLRKALQLFEGEHDFEYFMKSGSEVHHTVRTIHRTRLQSWGRYGVVYFEANGFLRAQVRMMLHAAFEIAQNNTDMKMLEEQIAHHRRHTTRLAPPQGLYLARVIY